MIIIIDYKKILLRQVDAIKIEYYQILKNHQT